MLHHAHSLWTNHRVLLAFLGFLAVKFSSTYGRPEKYKVFFLCVLKFLLRIVLDKAMKERACCKKNVSKQALINSAVKAAKDDL